MLGMDGLTMDPGRRGAQELLEEFRKAMGDAFDSPVIEEIATTDQSGTLAVARTRGRRWGSLMKTRGRRQLRRKA